MLRDVATLVREKADRGWIVHYAHMELATPTLPEGIDACVADGATDVIVLPYMLSPGRHATEDIPRMAAEAAAKHPAVTVRVSAPLGIHPLLAELVLIRATE